MHDPTEGGVRAALHEIAHAAGVAIEVDLDEVPVLPETDLLCRYFAIDPLGLLGSGALLVTAPRARAEALVRAWQRRGIEGRTIGVVRRGRSIAALRRGRRVRFPWVTRDEILKVLGD